MRKQQVFSSHWDPDSFTEEYILESNMFDYEEIKNGEFFGLKKYHDSFYRGELN